MTKLNPCPNCGNEPDVRMTNKERYIILCSCGLSTGRSAKTGGQAINTWNDITAVKQPVKTLRDEFAMAVLTGLLANSGGPMQRSCQSGWGLVNCDTEDIATFSYMIAREMLKERDRDNAAADK